MKTTTFFLAISLTVIIIITLFEYVAFDNEFYSEQFSKRTTLKHYSEAWMLHQNILNFHSGQPDADLDGLTHKEISHLLDVKNLYRAIVGIRSVLCVLFVLTLTISGYHYKKSFYRPVILACGYSAIMGWIFFLFLMITMESRFLEYFHGMHVRLFPVDSYSFDVTDRLVNLYPYALFYEMGKRFLFVGLGVFSLMLVIGLPAMIGTSRQASRGKEEETDKTRNCHDNGSGNIYIGSP